MRYIQCPRIYKKNIGEKSVFFAGGITGCRNWQLELTNLLEGEDLVVLNPRRENLDITFKDINQEQIRWEFDHLKLADTISFWFPKESICPITLYELGKVSMTSKYLFIGLDPSYSRKEDVEIQTALIRPKIRIVYSLEVLANQIKTWLKNG